MNRYLVLLSSILILTSYNLFGQRTQQRIDVGDNYFQQEQYAEALKVYEAVIKKDKSDETLKKVSFKIGDCHMMMFNYSKAREWYSIALNLGYEDPVVYLRLSEMALGLEDFSGSIVYASKFLELEPGNERGLKIMESAKYSADNYRRGTLFEVSFEEDLVSNWQEWGVSFMENVGVFLDDVQERQRRFDITIDMRYNNVLFYSIVRQELKDRIVFASTRPRTSNDAGGYSNIYQATYSKREGKWDTPILMGGTLNSAYYDAFLSFDKANRKGYFMNCGGLDGTRATCDIYVADYDNNRDVFNNVQLFQINNDEYSLGYPSINENGTVLYFASDMPGGYGGFDIYKVVRDSESDLWSEPINLGPTVNTRYNESYPIIAGNVLYFSSFGHPGYGGFDVFYSVIDENGNYEEPLNIGTPINSSADDFGFVISEDYTRGFFSSNRPGGTGTDDLYSFRLKVQTFTLKGNLTDKVTGEPISNIDIYIIGDDNSIFTASSNNNGYFEQGNLSSDVLYNIEIAPENYMPYSDIVAVKEQLIKNRFEVIVEYEMDIVLEPFDKDPRDKDPIVDVKVDTTEVVIKEPVVVKEPVVIKEPEVTKDHSISLAMDYSLPIIYFSFDKYNLLPLAKQKLDSVAQFMNQNLNSGIVVHAHTDEVSGYMYNFFLSQMRSHAIIEYLVGKGISQDRLYPIGHGKMQLLIKNATKDTEHQLNRRAHFETVDMTQFKAYWSKASQSSFRYLNSLNKEAHYASGVEFMIQIIAAKKPVPPQYYGKIMEKFPRLDIIYYYDNDKYHRYLVGSFKDFQAAFNVQKHLRDLGYEIYLVAFHDGERISVSKARNMTGN